MNEEQPEASPDEEELQGEEPEFFDRALLLQPPEVRQEYFEQRCLIEHPRLLEALEAILEAICAPGEEVLTRRPGTMVLVIVTQHPACELTCISSPLLALRLQSRDQADLTGSISTDPCFVSLAIRS